MLFLELARTSDDVARASGRLDKVGRLADLVSHLADDEVEAAVAFLSGTTRHGRLGVGHAAIASTFDIPPAAEPSLTLVEVDRALAEVGEAAGQGSARARTTRLGALVQRATALEQDFLRRVLYGELRQGALAGVLVDAIAKAAGVPAASLRRAAMLHGDLGQAARLALRHGESALTTAVVELMRPVQPMLAATGGGVDDAVEAFGDATFEYKLDGARVQVHKAGGDVRLYSRTLRDVTASAPEVVSLVRALPAESLILDGEVLAMRPDDTPHPFQVTMRRFGRSRDDRRVEKDERRADKDVERERESLPLTPFFFDCLYAAGEPLVDRPLEERARALQDVAGPMSVPRLVRPTVAEALAFEAAALQRGHEGVMAKDLASTYAAGRRGAAWLKIKRARTLDLVVLAAEWGHGRRHGWLSNLHLGARDPATNTFVMLGKTFKGMTDAMLTWQTERLLTLELGRDGHVVHVRPELVVEIAFNEIQESPVYPGGLALRFARVKRYRTDKTAADADTIETVRTMAERA